MKPLTIEQLKALEVGDWVWLISCKSGIGTYEQIRCSDDSSIFFDSMHSIALSDYGTKWLAYKNKEQAEAKGEITNKEDEINEMYLLVDEHNGSGECNLKKNCCEILYKAGYRRTISLSEAERRLAELKGETR